MTVPSQKQIDNEEERPTVALCPNSAYLVDAAEEWSKLAKALIARGCRVSLVTNDFPTDRATLAMLAAQFDLPIKGAGLSYTDYAALLGTFDAVISSRLHTGVMALTAGTPVIPVEGLDFKITAAMSAAGVPIPAVRPGDRAWVPTVMRSLEHILAEPAAANAWVTSVVERQRKGVHEFVDHLNEQLKLPSESKPRKSALDES
jgi:polysaccharide pyruvyl transferase WcaK-like protein